jgi:hypothetical protein
MADTTVPKTVAEIEELMRRVRDRVLSFRFTDVHTIDDYPIGGNHRGQCRLWVQVHNSRGSRMVRQTTDKRGTWCKPKFATYQPGLLIVCVMPSGRAGYLTITDYAIMLTDAAWRTETLAKNPLWRSPQREPVKFNIVTKELYSGKPAETTMMEQPADPPELIAAFECFRSHAQELSWAVRRAVNVPEAAPVASA